jgi:uncharacterized protein (TIGR02271 family)
MADFSQDTAYDSRSSRTLTALFDSEAEAERAVARLRDAGVPDSAIRITRGSADTNATYSGDAYADRQKGFFESLGDFFFPDEDRYTYAEGLTRGAHMVSVSDYDASLHDVIVDILDDEGSVDLDAREAEWRSSGWSDYRSSSYYTDRGDMSPAAAGMAAAAAGVAEMPARGTIYDDGTPDRDTRTVGDYQMAADMSGTSSGFGTAAVVESGASESPSGTIDQRSATGDIGLGAPRGDFDRDDETVKIVEERLDVTKRDVDQGRVRVRSYVREEPVSADVDLRSTRVFLERRPVDRAATDADIAFQDRTIEAREHAEEAVIRKEARVVEEIGLRQEEEVRHETVSDSVRRTEVEIEDERTGEVTRLGDTDSDRTGRF